MTWISIEGLLPGSPPCQAHGGLSPTDTGVSKHTVADEGATRLPPLNKRGATRRSAFGFGKARHYIIYIYIVCIYIYTRYKSPPSP